ncbi:B-box zinc finger protein 32-like [Olea europaea var. sylvestris]|uniref:B-box zinc finger 32-like n=1 Tax=Olea europaea subsp. europaea TaxID=158383 RepID=A0A8S0V2V1_OLEEU|nr:B-box zinc finger protein 32-like [Olea europaea var. sylvestris]CAA3023679.1 B-box zinc finger 32-like [Olea europaea subsp. europaea]
MIIRGCELCSAEAAIYCASDSAFLCRSCDSNVHEANFLVARHLRQTVCSQCKGFTGNFISGVGLKTLSIMCSSCCSPSTGIDLNSDSLLSSSTSICVSSTTTRKEAYSDRRETYGFDSTTSFTDNSCEFMPGKCMKNQRELNSIRSESLSKVDWKTEGVLVKWSRKLGLRSNDAVRMACDALRACLDQWTTLPFRVCLAASMWLGLGLCGDRLALKRLAEMSGVPAKLILVAQSKLHRLLKARRQHRRDHQLEEGWAECSA